MTTATPDQLPEDLTERQREVLRLLNEGKTPTEIGKELGVSSQGVHGHLQRLRKRGLVAGEAPAPKMSAKRPAPSRRNDRPVTPADAFDEVRESVQRQRAALEARATELDAEIAQLQDEIKRRREEKKGVEKAGADLTKFEETLPA